MNPLSNAGVIVGGLSVALLVGILLWTILSVRPLRQLLVMYHEPERQRVTRVPSWRLSLVAGAVAGLAAAAIFAMLAAY